MRDLELRRARRAAAWLGAGPVALAGVVALAGGDVRESALDVPAALAGLIALPVAWRAHAALLDRARRAPGESARAAGFAGAIVAALCVTAVAATFGVVVYALSREILPLVGLAMHAILARGLWPSPERLDAFVDGPEPAAP